MLDVLRRRARIILWFIVIAVSTSFVFWVGGRGTRAPEQKKNYAGTIFGRKVSVAEYGRAWWASKNNAILIYGSNRFREIVNSLNLDEEAWNRLTLLAEAKRRGITTSDDAVRRNLQTIFGRDGKFDRQLYESFLRFPLRTSARRFEEDIRNDISIRKLNAIILSEVSITDAILEEEYRREFEKAEVRYLLVEMEDFEKEIEIQENEIIATYQTRREEFRIPTQVNAEYIALDFADFGSNITITDEEVAKYYENRREEFRENPSSLPEQEGEAETGEAEYLPLEKVSDTIRRYLTQEESLRLVEEKAEKIADSLIDNPDLAAVSEIHQLPVRETGFFTMNDPVPQIGWSQAFLTAAFRLKEDEISDIIRTPRGYYFIRVKGKKESYIPELEETKARVEDVLHREKAKTLAHKKAEEYHRALNKEGVDFADTAASLGLEVRESEPLARDSYLPGIGRSDEFNDYAFRLKNGEISPVITTLKGSAIMQVKKFYPADMERFAEEKEEYEKKVLAKFQQRHYQEWFESLRIRVDLKINPEWNQASAED